MIHPGATQVITKTYQMRTCETQSKLGGGVQGKSLIDPRIRILQTQTRTNERCSDPNPCEQSAICRHSAVKHTNNQTIKQVLTKLRRTNIIRSPFSGAGNPPAKKVKREPLHWASLSARAMRRPVGSTVASKKRRRRRAVILASKELKHVG